MKKFFKYTAEHIGRTRATKFVHTLEDENVDVMHAMMDPIFENQFILFVKCTDAEAKVIKNRVWELNNGAYNEMVVVDADEMEEYL